jgi:hypothetical protein
MLTNDSVLASARLARVACSAAAGLHAAATKLSGSIGSIGRIRGGLFAAAVGPAISHGNALGKGRERCRDGGRARWWCLDDWDDCEVLGKNDSAPQTVTAG